MSRAWTLPEALVYGHGIERRCLCPVHDDTDPSASVNILIQKWHCFSCGASGKLTGEHLLVEPDYQRLAKHLEQQAYASGRSYSEAWLNKFDSGEVHPYWLERFDEATARHWRLGYDHIEDAVTYPLRRPSGVVLGVVMRPLGAHDGPKYKYPWGVDISRLIFNYSPMGRKAIVLVEGALDAIALWRSGIDAWALYGSSLSQRQIELINAADPEVIYTAFDLDSAGRRAHTNVRNAFPQRRVEAITWPMEWGKDVDEIGPEKCEEVFDDLLRLGLSCVEYDSCGSHPLPPRKTTVSSPGSSQPRKLRIVRTSA